MDSVKIDITGDRKAGLRFDEFPDALYDDLRDVIDELSGELFARVKASMPVDSGDLLAKTRLRLFTDKNRITGYVDIAGAKGSQDFAKAAALEHGAKRETKVVAHKMRLDHHWDEKLARPQTVMVEAYSRKANIAEHSFQRGSLAEMRPKVIDRLNSTVKAAVSGANA